MNVEVAYKDFRCGESMTDQEIMDMDDHHYWCHFVDPPSMAGRCDCPLRSKYRDSLLSERAP